MRFESSKEVGVEGCDEVVVVLLLRGLRECGPGESVNVPGVVETDIGEAQGYCAPGFGEEGHEEVGAEGDGCGDGGLWMLSEYSSQLNGRHVPCRGRLHARRIQ